jgi:hypothetical protein
MGNSLAWVERKHFWGLVWSWLLFSEECGHIAIHNFSLTFLGLVFAAARSAAKVIETLTNCFADEFGHVDCLAAVPLRIMLFDADGNGVDQVLRQTQGD